MKTLIENADVVTRGGIIKNGYVLFSDVIEKVGSGKPPAADRVVDGTGCLVMPGFVDIHCHGGAGVDFIDATEEEIRAAEKFHLSHGTTTLVATTLTATEEEIESALCTIDGYIRKNPRSTVSGVHLEGPWLNPAQCGAQDTRLMKLPDPALLVRLKKAYPSVLRISVAPELKGGTEICSTAKDLGIVVAAAHTDADYGKMEEAWRAGYSIVTHLWSGMKGVTRKNAFRTGGAVEAGLVIDGLAVELIADGRHLPKELLALAYKCKGSGGICLVTDAVRAAGLKDGERSIIGSRKNGHEIIVEDGVAKTPDRQSFAGSVATFDRLCKNMSETATSDPVALSEMCSATPARVMGFTDRGEIKEGLRADLLLTEKDFTLKKIFTFGDMVK